MNSSSTNSSWTFKNASPWLVLGGSLLAALALLSRAAGGPPQQPSSNDTAAVETEAPETETRRDESGEYRLETIRGRVVWFGDALQRRGIRTVPESQERVLVLETNDGQLVPLLEDIRGRAFRVDERLRQLPDCELLVRRYVGIPAVKIVQVFSHEEGRKLELDYWCEICAITMFELKACDCCQGDIELRRRVVKD